MKDCHQSIAENYHNDGINNNNNDSNENYDGDNDGDGNEKDDA